MEPESFLYTTVQRRLHKTNKKSAPSTTQMLLTPWHIMEESACSITISLKPPVFTFNSAL